MKDGGRVVLTYGTFDLFHIGHLNILKRARELGDFLVVAVSTDQFNAIKGKKAFFNYADRRAIVEACRYVGLVIPEDDWGQKERDIIEHKVDTFVMGDDWAGKFDHLQSLCEVHYLPRTPSISSTQLKMLSNVTVNGTLVDELKTANELITNVVRRFENLL